MSDRYIITKSSFLESWTVTSPTRLEDNGYGLECVAEGKIVDSLAAAVEWMDGHAMGMWLKHYYSHTAPERVY